MGGSNNKKISWLGLIGLLLVILLAACDTTTPIPSSNGTATSSEGAPQLTKTVPSPAGNPNYKVDTLLSDLLLKYNNGGMPLLRQFARDLGLLDESNQLHFSLTLLDQTALPVVQAKVQQLGGQIFEQYQEQVGIAVSLDAFDTFQKHAGNSDFWHQLADLPQVRDLKVLPRPGVTEFGAQNQADPNQGVVKTGADGWQQAGFRGQDVKVGIIDGGFKGYKSFLGTPALPSQVTLKSFLFGGSAEGNEEHGVAVAEIVHSLAPDAQLILTPIEDEIGFANAVDYLLQNHVKIIQASLGWGGLWPGDGTGLMDRKLDEARRQGVLPIVSAGNYGQSHFMGNLNADAVGYTQFETGRNILKLTAEADSSWVALRWDEAWDTPQTNLDLYVLDSSKQILGTSRNVQGGGSQKPPTELVPFRTSPGQVYYIQVRLVGKAAKAQLHFHLFAYNAEIENSTPAQSLATPGDARGAVSVGATNWNDDKVENYSSQGPTQDGRLKPELMAPTDVASLVYGRYNQAFGGTSAAAPQVSGVAALAWSALPNLNADQVARYLERNAVPLGGGGRQATTGFGRLKLGSPLAVKGGIAALLGPLPSGPAFQDDFRNGQSGLPDDILAYYGKSGNDNPGYFMQVDKNGVLGWSVYNQSDFSEFRADFVVTPPAQSQVFYGLVFWQQAPDNYHVLLVNGNQYALLRRNGSEWNTLINWSSDAALQTNGSNIHLGVEATATYIKVLAGDNLLQTVPLSANGLVKIGGKLGFACGTFGFGTPPGVEIAKSETKIDKTVVSFDTLMVTPLSS